MVVFASSVLATAPSLASLWRAQRTVKGQALDRALGRPPPMASDGAALPNGSTLTNPHYFRSMTIAELNDAFRRSFFHPNRDPTCSLNTLFYSETCNGIDGVNVGRDLQTYLT